MNDDNFMLILILIVTNIFGAFEQYAKKIVLRKTDITSVLFMETILISTIILSYILYTKSTNDIYKSIREIDDYTYTISILGIIVLAFNVYCHAYLLKRYNLNVVSVYGRVFGLFINILISYFILKENITRQQCIGYLIIIIGFYISYKN
jgi:drug/metabolite transporter (DMT)-like permease